VRRIREHYLTSAFTDDINGLEKSRCGLLYIIFQAWYHQFWVDGMAVNRQDRKLLEWTKHPSWPMKAHETGLPSKERLKYKFLLSRVQECGH
jgi:hypothetical protein